MLAKSYLKTIEIDGRRCDGIVELVPIKFNKRQLRCWNIRMKLWRKFSFKNFHLRKEALRPDKEL